MCVYIYIYIYMHTYCIHMSLHVCKDSANHVYADIDIFIIISAHVYQQAATSSGSSGVQCFDIAAEDEDSTLSFRANSCCNTTSLEDSILETPLVIPQGIFLPHSLALSLACSLPAYLPTYLPIYVPNLPTYLPNLT